MREKNYVREMIEKFASDEENRTALKCYDGEQVTDVSYNSLAESILLAAGYFQKKGMTRKHVALLTTNCRDWIIAFFAIVASGNVVVPLNPALPKKIVLSQCDQTDIVAICGGKAEVACFAGVYPCISMGLLGEYEPMQLSDIFDADQDESTLLLLTSGTTGQSKAVEITYANMECSIKSEDGVFTEPEIHRVMTVLPMFHIAGIRGTLAMLYRYKTLCAGRGAMHLFRDMPVLYPDYILLVPQIVESFVKIMKRTSYSDLQKNYIGPNLKRICVGGAPISPEVCKYLMERGFTVDSGYALSETTGVGTWGKWDEGHFNTIGKISNELQYRIVDGELQFKGKPIMKGYYKDPVATATAIEDGWLHTGDMGFCDEDGYFYLIGRKKNLIVMPNGEKINPEEIEMQFEKYDEIAECRISYDDRSGILCIEIRTDKKESAQEIIDLYNEKMPMPYQVRKVIYREKPFERTASGKLIRKECML